MGSGQHRQSSFCSAQRDTSDTPQEMVMPLGPLQDPSLAPSAAPSDEAAMTGIMGW